MRVCLVSTYPPQRCGLAHYSRNLTQTITRLGSRASSFTVLGERRGWIRNNSLRDGGVTAERTLSLQSNLAFEKKLAEARP